MRKVYEQHLKCLESPWGFELSNSSFEAGTGSVVYGSRMGNGGPETGDGWRYRGRGLIQITGTDNYKLYGGYAGVDIYNNPELANDPKNACKLAVAYLTKPPKARFITWTDTNFTSLANQFKNAVGYADPSGSKTVERRKLGQGIWQQIKNGDSTPLMYGPPHDGYRNRTGYIMPESYGHKNLEQQLFTDSNVYVQTQLVLDPRSKIVLPRNLSRIQQ